NAGLRAGSAPYVLLLNPDTTIDAESVRTLAQALAVDERAGVVGPRIVDSAGTLEWSQRRFPRPRNVYAQALFAHRFFPHLDEVVRDAGAHATPGTPGCNPRARTLLRRHAVR